MKLCGTGWTDWKSIAAVAGGWMSTWVDLEGPHLEALPESAPDTTHLWAWSQQYWMRARIDEGAVVVGFLHQDVDCPQGGASCVEVPVSSQRLAGSWTEHHIRVGSLRDTEWLVLEVLDDAATLFVRSKEDDA